MSSLPIARVLSLTVTAIAALAVGAAMSAVPFVYLFCPLAPILGWWTIYRVSIWSTASSRAGTLLALGCVSVVCGVAIARPEQTFQRRLNQPLHAHVLTVRELREQLHWDHRGPALSQDLLEQRLMFVDDRPCFDDVDRALRAAGARLRYSRWPQSLSMWSGMDFFGVEIVPLEENPPPLHGHRPVLIRWT